MEKKRLLVLLPALVLGIGLVAQEEAEFGARRAACSGLLGDGQALLVRAVTERGARQGNDFFYLTGITASGGALLLQGDGSAVLFAAPSRRGRRSPEPAPRGFAEVKTMNELDGALAELAAGDRLVEGRRAGALIGRLRRIKSPAELARLRTAIDITCAAHREVMRAAEPGLHEYQLQAILEFVFAFQGAARPGFSSIVGSGPNSCILHWSQNTRQTSTGDVVVIDIGAEFGMYTADVTRTIPISGRFTKRQRQRYEVVLAANEAAIAMIGPGVNMRDVSAKASEVLAAGLVDLGILERGDRAGLRRYYYHGLSHPIGLQVHDVGGLGVLEPGMVITIEPGLYFRDEGMGFRIEDDVLVTADGHEVLSAAAPKKAAEVEKLMAGRGLDLRRIRTGQQAR